MYVCKFTSVSASGSGLPGSPCSLIYVNMHVCM